MLNFQGKPLEAKYREAEGPKEDIFKQKVRKEQHLKASEQLFTGNIAIDFTQPIAKGNITLFEGESRTGNNQNGSLKHRIIAL